MATAAPLVLLLLILQLCSRGAPPGALAALIQPQRTNTGPQQTKTQADEPRRLRPKDLVVTTVALQYVPGIPFRRGQNALPPPARDSAAKATTTPKKTTTTTGRDPVFVPRRQDSGPQRTARMYSYEDVLKHNYVFIVGGHHSGTSLMNLLLGESAFASALSNSSAIENEGQWLQTVYPTGLFLGGKFSYGYSQLAHMTETHASASESTAALLFSSWAPYWNLKAPTLIEKSPPHLLKTRFFAKIFTPDRSRFVVMFRHPLATAHFMLKGNKAQMLQQSKAVCFQNVIAHWLHIYKLFFEDLKSLNSSRVLLVQYEHLMGYGAPTIEAAERRTQALVDRVYAFVGLPDKAKLRFRIKDPSLTSSAPLDWDLPADEQAAFDGEDSGEPETTPAAEAAQGQPPAKAAAAPPSVLRRHLLEFHGNRQRLVIEWEKPTAWLHDYPSLAGNTVCRQVARRQEAELRKFGYSMKSLHWVGRPTISPALWLWSADDRE